MATTPYGIIHFFPGGTREQYLSSIGAVHPGKGQLPAGQIFHASGASVGGWTVLAVHESKESWEVFRDTILFPRMEAGIEGGFETMPVETVIDLITVMPEKYIGDP